LEETDRFGPTPPEAGKSSFDLMDFEEFFKALPLPAEGTVADLGCGEGRYSIAIAERAGPGTKVWGFDLWEEGIKKLSASAAALGLGNLTARRANLTDLSCLDAGCVDLVLMVTVLHDLAERGDDARCLAEARRILKGNGFLAVVEFRKIDSKPGPPVSMRLSPEEVATIAAPSGFSVKETLDMGPSLYLTLLRPAPK